MMIHRLDHPGLKLIIVKIVSLVGYHKEISDLLLYEAMGLPHLFVCIDYNNFLK